MTTKTGILLVNLGTPAAPTTSAVKAFLSQFLQDPRVVEIPRLLWSPLLNFVILPLRAPRVSKLYQQIWTEQGSPLMAISQRQRDALEQRAAGVDPRQTVGERRVHVEMRIDEGRRHQLVLCIDHLVGRRRKTGRDLDDAPALHGDGHVLAAVGQRGVNDE